MSHPTTTHPATLAVHADWSVDARKRWMTLARRRPRGWVVAAPCPVGDPIALPGRLRHSARGGAVALGVDFPIGLPRAYAARHVAQPDFLAFLRTLTGHRTFFAPCDDLADIAPMRPFYPARPESGMTRAAHASALGLAAAELSRLCDRATAERPAGASLFWTLGANQTGKAAIAAWRDFLLPALATAKPPRLWPFEGNFLELLTPDNIVIAETYPAEAMRQVGLTLPGSKRRQADRAALAGALLVTLQQAGANAEPTLVRAMAAGFPPEHGEEDGFDSLLGLLSVLAVLDGRRPDGIPTDPALRRWEGWVLGQTALPTATLEDIRKEDMDGK